jgi:hypothetical protein
MVRKESRQDRHESGVFAYNIANPRMPGGKCVMDDSRHDFGWASILFSGIGTLRKGSQHGTIVACAVARKAVNDRFHVAKCFLDCRGPN